MKKAKEKKVILAVAYCRKSTKTERTEKSIADQRARITKLAPSDDGARYDIVRWYAKDKGVPGWKRGAARPDYATLVNELKETGAKAILVDDMDRFSRADELEVAHEVQELREKHGIRFIHAANQGCIDLLANDAHWKIALSAMAGHEFSSRLSRRIANARCDAAKQGKRSGGKAPYAMENDGNGGLTRGDKSQVEIVKWIFDQFANQRRSMFWIAGDLNEREKLAPNGGQWRVTAIKQILQRREYAGHFDFARRKVGQFHIINASKEVVAVSNYDGNRPNRNTYTDDRVFLKENVYKNPIIAPKIFDKAQQRFDKFKADGKHRPRNGFPLTSVLYCGHCGAPMTGCTPTGRKYHVYRCSSPGKSATCHSYEIREERILPQVLALLKKEIANVAEMLTAPPDELTRPNKAKAERRAQAQKERDKLAGQIKTATRNLMLSEDPDTRKDMDAEITAMRAELIRLDVELGAEPETVNGYSKDQFKHLSDWWKDFEKRAVSVPVKDADVDLLASFYLDPAADPDDPRLLIDPRKVNQSLLDLGCKVTLQWSTGPRTRKDGKQRRTKDGKGIMAYTLDKARFQLGQKTGALKIDHQRVSSSIPHGEK